MKILFIANHLNVGGITSYLFTLASGLVGKDHQVYLVSSGGQLEDKFNQAGIKLFKAPLGTKSEISPKIFFSFLKIKNIIREFNIELVHSHSRTTQVLGCLLSQFLSKPHIFTCHGFFKTRWSRRAFPCWGQKVIAISQQVKEHLIADFKLDARKISVIHNGIDTKNFGDFSQKDNLREQLGMSNNLLIGIIARLSDVKGHAYLIQAMSQIVKKFPQARVLIIGQGKTEQLLIKQTQDLGLKEKIIFISEAKNTRDLLATMDIFVMPSLQEGLGLALMEAMAQGLAVVGSAVGGIKTLIQDKVNGLLVEPANVGALAQALGVLLGDAQLRRVLGSQAREFIITNFSKEEMVDRTEAVYQQVLKV